MYAEAAEVYEPLVGVVDSLLGLTAIVAANLCVAYIMAGRNQQAEALMRRVEAEEDRLAFEVCGELESWKVGICRW